MRCLQSYHLPLFSEPVYRATDLFTSLIFSTFDFEVTILVSLGAILSLAVRIGRSIWTVIWTLVSNNWMAEVSVSSTDEVHGHLIRFLAHQYKVKSARRLVAQTPSKSAWELDSDDTEIPETSVHAEGNIKWLNFSNQEAKSHLRFTPAIRSHSFWRKWHLLPDQ